MSTPIAVVSHPDDPPHRTAGDEHALWRLARASTPRQGWIAYGLLLGILLTVSWLITDAAWVETPGLAQVMLLSSFSGLALARVRLHALLLLPIGVAIGAVFVSWQMTTLMDSGSLSGQVQEFGRRLYDTYQAAASDDISTDLTALSTILLGAAWLMGFVSAWFLFRNSNIWVTLLLAGNAMITILSFMTGDLQFTSRFFLFLFFAMLLMVRVNSIQNHDTWERTHVSYRPNASWLTLHGAGWLSALILLAAALLPLNAYVSRTMFDAWNNTGRAPFALFEDEFARLFSGITSLRDLTGRFFGSVLPFGGSIAFNGDIVMEATSEIPTHWASQTYSKYTSQGWKAGPIRKVEVGPDSLPVPQESMQRESIQQSVRLNFSTTELLAGGNLEHVSRKAVLEVLAPMFFEISLSDSEGDVELPEDVRAIAERLRDDLKLPTDGFVESRISRQLPSDLVLMNVSYGKGPESQLKNVTRFLLARKEPLTQDIVAWNFARQTQPGKEYTMVTGVSVATYDDLRTADTQYSGFIQDHYLQLPSTLPSEVRDLAATVTASGETPVDKALAVQEFLRDPARFEYTRDIDAPPAGADGVAHFLLDSKKGYSDYYASAMAVMLRAVGVPARIAGGYAAGEQNESGNWVVRDTDSHTWVNVYFPGFGWIDFEPTPQWIVFVRGTSDGDGQLALGLPTDQSEQPRRGVNSVLAECLEKLILEEEECFEEGDDAGFSDDIGSGGGDLPMSWILIAAGSVLSALAFLALALRAAWTLGLGSLNHVERLYTKMNKLGTLAGIRRDPDQTPAEYAARMGHMLPAIASDARAVSWAYAAARYGRQEPSDQQLDELDASWRGIREGLLRRGLRRLLPGRTR